MEIKVSYDSQLKNIENKIIENKTSAMNDLSKKCLEYAKSLVPVRTGKLKNSLKSEVLENTIKITTDVDYAKVIEYGDMYRKPYAFMSKTLIFMKSEIEKLFKM